MNPKITMQSFMSINEFKDKKPSKIFAKVCKDGTKVVMKNDEPVCVLVPPDEYDDMIAMIEEYERLLDILTDEANVVTIDLDANLQEDVLEDDVDDEADDEDYEFRAEDEMIKQQAEEEELMEIETEFEELSLEGLDHDIVVEEPEHEDEWVITTSEDESEEPATETADEETDDSSLQDRVAQVLKDFSVNDFDMDVEE